MKFFWYLGIFICGSTVSTNLFLLVDHNQDYQASWWKVWFAVIIARSCVYFLESEK